jgi:3-oxoacyl-[acyl-carrier protein] reductase
MRIKGRVAFVTGSSRGIGAAIARRLAQDGADLVLHARADRERCEAVAGSIRAAGRKADVLIGDLAQGDTATELVEQAFAIHGELDILVLNAGGGKGGMAVDLSSQAIDLTLALNLRATISAAIAFAKKTMSDHGRIVYISSGMATHAAPGVSIGAAAKAGSNDRRPDMARAGPTMDGVTPSRGAAGHRRHRRVSRIRRSTLAHRRYVAGQRWSRHDGREHSRASAALIRASSRAALSIAFCWAVLYA